jgi:hypothetical protein
MGRAAEGAKRQVKKGKGDRTFFWFFFVFLMGDTNPSGLASRRLPLGRRFQVAELRQNAKLRLRDRLRRPCSYGSPRFRGDKVVRGGGYNRLVDNVLWLSGR